MILAIRDDRVVDGAVNGTGRCAVRTDGAVTEAIRIDGAVRIAVRTDRAVTGAVNGAGMEAMRTDRAVSRADGAGKIAVRTDRAVTGAVNGAVTIAVRTDGAVRTAVRADGVGIQAAWTNRPVNIVRLGPVRVDRSVDGTEEAIGRGHAWRDGVGIETVGANETVRQVVITTHGCTKEGKVADVVVIAAVGTRMVPMMMTGLTKDVGSDITPQRPQAVVAVRDNSLADTGVKRLSLEAHLVLLCTHVPPSRPRKGEVPNHHGEWCRHRIGNRS
jgi:hypothetical protein